MNRFYNRSVVFLSALAICMAAVAGALGQEPVGAPKVPKGIAPGHPPVAPVIAVDNFERSLAVDPSLNLQLCVTQGDVKVNGWNRNELRVFVHDGSKFAFKVLQNSPKSQAPVWIALVGVDEKRRTPAATECIAGGEIEIDVPLRTTINFKGQETSTVIDSVRKVDTKTIGGDISIRNVTEGVTAATYEGDVTVESSSGPMSLESTTGNIVVFEAGPSDVGDGFRAKTSGGAISLQNLGYRQVEANSISGSVSLIGDILSNGTYAVGTQNGSIRLALPQNTACSVITTYGYGSFNSALPFEVQTENLTPGDVKRIVGTLGKGGTATLRLTTGNGTIAIKKL